MYAYFGINLILWNAMDQHDDGFVTFREKETLKCARRETYEKRKKSEMASNLYQFIFKTVISIGNEICM